MFDEVNRKKKGYEKGIVISFVIIGIAFITFIPVGMSGTMPFVNMIFFMGGGLMSIYFTSQIKKLSNEFKAKYVEPELQKIFPGSEFFFDTGFTEEEVVNTKLLHRQDRFSSEDMIIGNFDGVKFCSSDVHMQDVRKSGKSTTVVTVFQGRIYEFDFNKNFKYNLLLLQKGQFRPFEGFNKIKMESVVFNSELKVYAKNDHEAFYILTPQFMERLLELDHKYSDKISFSFKNNKLFIAVDNRIDNFDIKAFKIVDSTIFDSYLQEFLDMKEFIVLLKLNSRLFKEF
ncbi:hypothetical protein KQ51_00257 [Candidatus Izimaplasma bacterium HR1]|jgi:hypothetical protein|uniref:DUF3137 domain-containing protein n=1 Tax=Candidatus Izimoplasma sp. HR1 TaxID=1541959 RepID=UPI0004F65F96|nr:hypothetical protein KQ51_00257 [Candidatus Izimaplasma bacterium HR1]